MLISIDYKLKLCMCVFGCVCIQNCFLFPYTTLATSALNDFKPEYMLLGIDYKSKLCMCVFGCVCVQNDFLFRYTTLANTALGEVSI